MSLFKKAFHSAVVIMSVFYFIYCISHYPKSSIIIVLWYVITESPLTIGDVLENICDLADSSLNKMTHLLGLIIPHFKKMNEKLSHTKCVKFLGK